MLRVCFQGEALPAGEEMLRVPALVIGPCLAGIHHRIITAEVAGLGPQAFPGHDEDQVAERAAELREAVTRHPQVDVAR